MKKVLLTVLLLAMLGLSTAALVVWRGWYDVSATSGHLAVVYRLLDVAMQRSVAHYAEDIETPGLDHPELVSRGAACYRDHCAQCHGGPGVAPGSVGMSLQPLPGPLMDAAERWRPRELYWITRHGIKMSGMPAWELRLPDRDLWALTAFLQRLPALTPAAYGEATGPAVAACRTANEACVAGECPREATAAERPIVPRSRLEAGSLALRQYACIACHRIPGIVGPDTHVGPPLDAWARRQRISGDQPNTEAALVRFIRHPQEVDPGTAMPDLGVTEEHARLMAEYLLAQE